MAMMNCKTVKMHKFEFYKNKVSEAESNLIKAIYELAKNDSKCEISLSEIKRLNLVLDLIEKKGKN